MSHRYYCYVFFEFNVSLTAPNFLASSQTRGGGESVKSDGVKPDVDGELTCTHATISANTNWQTKPKLLRSDSSLVATWSLHFPRNHIKKQQSLVTNIVTLRMQHMSKWHMAAKLKNNIFLVLSVSKIHISITRRIFITSNSFDCLCHIVTYHVNSGPSGVKIFFDHLNILIHLVFLRRLKIN